MQEHAEEWDPARGSLGGATTPGTGPIHAVLLVDDEPSVRSALARSLRRPGLRLLEAGLASEAMAILEGHAVDLVISDQRLPDRSGIDLLSTVRTRWPRVRRVLSSGAEDFSLMREAVNRAEIDYFLPKPWRRELLQELLSGLPDRSAAARSAAGGAAVLRADARFPEIIGGSPVIRELLDLVAKVADTDSTALVTGETGTGKELVGRAIHQASRRSRRVFSAVNSAAFPETLLESELFGHRRGAFTGASANKKGLFEHANHGTVFLDEVAEMPLSMQAKLLRFLQTGEIRAVGDETVRRVDVRLVTATNKDLEEEVEAGRFREDLYYRLAVIPIHVAALRARVEDIPELAQHFLGRMSAKASKAIDSIEPAAMELLVAHTWPGNVRELENVIERGVALCRGSRIVVEDLPRRLRERPVRAAAENVQSLPSLQRRHILDTLDKVGWNRKRAAELLEISTTTLWRRLKEFGIEGDASRARADGERVSLGR